MSLSASLSNALTGLTASTRAAELVSGNVANATTEGYARRELLLSSQIVGGAGAGVRIDGVQRVVDEGLLRDRRLAEASLAEAQIHSDFFDDVLGLIGLTDDASSLNSSVVSFESALTEAAARPESEARLAAVLQTASQLSVKLNSISDGIQKLRVDADATIAATVEDLNLSLEQIHTTNRDILRFQAVGQDTSGLLDQRQRLIDQVAEIVPLNQYARGNGTVALYSLGGVPLLDAGPAEIEFEPTAPITADMTLASGALSGLSIDGRAITAIGPTSEIPGGRLAALFQVRDRLAPDAQANTDEVARDLIVRFQDQNVDPTLLIDPPPIDPMLPTQLPGLFTDAGALLDSANLTGVAGRISVNSLVDPSNGGALWRLRDGLGATTPGPVGGPTLLSSMEAALQQNLAPNGNGFGTAEKSASGFALALLSLVGQSSTQSQRQLSFEQARFDSLRQAELVNGVDTDREMQKLLLVEQAYAANARVIQSVDEMMQILIGI